MKEFQMHTERKQELSSNAVLSTALCSPVVWCPKSDCSWRLTSLILHHRRARLNFWSNNWSPPVWGTWILILTHPPAKKNPKNDRGLMEKWCRKNVWPVFASSTDRLPGKSVGGEHRKRGGGGCHHLRPVWIRPLEHVGESAWGIAPGGKDN